MKRYHEEKHIIENRIKLYRQLNGWVDPSHDKYIPAVGKFRKAIRCAGCGKAACQLCHPEKNPKRKPTRKEQQSDYDLKNLAGD